MDYKEYIESNADIMLGKPMVKGTRITVALPNAATKKAIEDARKAKTHKTNSLEQLFTDLKK